MKRLLKDAKGAVTVFVTLLLIPAVLISGLAVDLARIHTARSIVHNANQLAANAVLTQYDAMLNDIYGLYAVMESDPILGNLLNDYIQVSVYGEDWQDKSLGSFQLFYGSDIQEPDVSFAEDKHLRNIDVLRRQIEEYSKFRAPVIIVEEVLDRIDQFKKLKADSEVIEDKMAIDDKIGEIDKLYKELYELINDVNNYNSAEDSTFDDVNDYLDKIKSQLRDLQETREDWTDAFDDTEDGDELDDGLEEKYNGIKVNITALINGGFVGSNWILDSGWNSETYCDGIKQTIDDGKDDLNSYIEKMTQLIEKCEEADAKKSELSTMVNEFEAKLNSGNCSDEMKNGMTTPVEPGKPSIIEEYRNLLAFSLPPMAKAVRTENESYINSTIEILDVIAYGSVTNNVLGVPKILFDNPISMPEQIFGIKNVVLKRIESSTDTATLDLLATLSSYHYTAPTEFKVFQDSDFDSTHNAEFYGVLSDRHNHASNDHESKRDEAKGSITKLLDKAQDLFTKLTLTPEGAKYYRVGEGGDASGFGNDGDWGNEDEASSKTQDALNSSILGEFGNLLDDAGNKILLLTYDTEMFSNFTTVPETETMSGVPMGTDINYFFQSEMEYLFNGNEKSARSNLATVSGLVFLVRFVFNYISTFTISQINNELTMISSAAGPFAPAVRELARLGYALAESAIDMKELLSRPSRAATLFKKNISEWTFSVSGNLASIPATLAGFVGKEPGNKDSGMFYVDYLRIFLLFVDGDTLATRTADLITWNITNKKNSINANEASMASATLFNMSKAHTDFSITTTTNLRMLFLSMPFAQKGINGIIPPKTFPVKVTDYRGY